MSAKSGRPSARRRRGAGARTEAFDSAPRRLPSGGDALFRPLIEHTNDLLSVLAADGTVKYASPSHARTLGYDPKDLVGRSAFELVHPEDLGALVERFRSGITGPGTIGSGEFRYRCADGSWRTLEAVGVNLLDDPAVRGVVINTRDVTERVNAAEAIRESEKLLAVKVHERTADLSRANDAMRAEINQRREAEESLRQSEEKYRELVERINDVIFTVDETGRITYISPAIESLTGHTPTEVLGHSFTEYVHPDDLSPLLASFEETIGGRSELFEYRIVDKHGRVHWLRSRSQPVVQGGRTVGLRGVLTDITERRRAEEELQKRQAEIARVQRLTIAGEMTAELAHEINQPLGAIANFADGLAARLRDGNFDHDAMREVAEQISAQARRAGEVLRRVRAFLRKGDTLRERYDVNRLLREVSRLLEPDFRRHSITVKFILDPALPELDLDRIQVEQVVINLLRNAIEAMAENDGDRFLDIGSAATENGMALVTFKDTGIGIPRGAEDRIFDAFFTTKPEGLGMGLSVSRSIIEASGGRLWAARNPDRGSTVAFTLPMSDVNGVVR